MKAHYAIEVKADLKDWALLCQFLKPTGDTCEQLWQMRSVSELERQQLWLLGNLYFEVSEKLDKYVRYNAVADLRNKKMKFSIPILTAIKLIEEYTSTKTNYMDIMSLVYQQIVNFGYVAPTFLTSKQLYHVIE